MRISDWSSDVCSSDLHPVDSEGAVIPPAFLDIGEQRDGDKPPAMVMRPDILVAAVEDMEEEGQKRRFGHGDAGEILAAFVAGECPGFPESPVDVFAPGEIGRANVRTTATNDQLGIRLLITNK